MELYLDTCDAAAVEKLCRTLTVSGVTTNPGILAKSGMKPDQAIEGLLHVLNEDQKLFVQTLSTDYNGILAEARRIAGFREKNCFVKIPVTPEGLAAIKQAKKEGIGVLATAIYSAQQAFLAAMNGADYLAPYVNRMCNYCDGIQEVKDLLAMLKCAGLTSKVIAASFKNTRQVHELLLAGIDAVTVPCDVAWSMINHPGTGIAVNEFTDIWNKTYGIK